MGKRKAEDKWDKKRETSFLNYNWFPFFSVRGYSKLTIGTKISIILGFIFGGRVVTRTKTETSSTTAFYTPLVRTPLESLSLPPPPHSEVW